MTRTRLPAAAAAVLLAACAATTATAAPRDRVVLPDDVEPIEYRIDVTPDPLAPTFTATVEIDLDVRRATSRIVLNSAELVIDRAALGGEARAPAIAYDEQGETATFAFAHPIARGRHTLTLAYHGLIHDQPEGLFALKYATPQGEARALFTQFESTDARRFVPCWDEPARKAVFRLSATLPAGLVPVGNMPVAAAEPRAGGTLQHVRFAPTPRMSSYLLYFGAGDFERVHRDVGGVDVGVVVKRGDTASAAYALDAAAALLPYFDGFFGVRYPLPKLDMIAGPGDSVSFGAMENWGAIFYFERDLLVDPRIATAQDRQDVFLTIAHEMAHQWFGDLVTMDWWDDLWLNEGFATWMENKAAAQLHPEWKPWLQTLRGKDRAMGTDARAGTHPVVVPVRDELQSDDGFDEITYEKGAQVIRTLEATIGADAFRAGVRRYMARHAYGNTVTDDLWREMDDGPGHPLARIAHDLTLQPGVPLVRERAVSCRAGRTELALVQDEFRISGDAVPARQWHVPVALATPHGQAVHTIVAGAAPRHASVPGCDPVLLNAGQAAWFRSRYTDPALAALAARMPELAPDDQLGLLADTEAFALHGELPMGTLADLLQRVPADADPVVALALVERLRGLDRLAAGQPAQPALRRFALGLLQPFARRTGWEPAAGEGANEARLREALLEALGDLGDPAVVAAARTRFERFLEVPASLTAATRRIVLHVAATNADARTWAALHELARGASTHLERNEYYALLAIADDPTLATQALDVALSGEPPATTPAAMLRAAAEAHPRLAFGVIAGRWDRVEPLLGADSARSAVPRLLEQAADAELLPQLEAFAAAHVPPTARRGIRKAAAAIGDRAGQRVARLPELSRWLETRDAIAAAR
jgi:aminopeptidase N